MFYKTLCAIKPIKKSNVAFNRGALTVRLAKRKDLKALYRLRFDCFYKEYLGLPESVTGIDINRYDVFANYLILTDHERLVGSYRLLTGDRQKDFSFFETFNCLNFKDLKAPVVELSRACIAPSHRNGPIAILLLWRGLAAYLRELGAKTLVGRVSMPGDDPTVVRSLYDFLKQSGGYRTDILAVPKKPLPPGPSCEFNAEMMPSILRSYLRLGAKVAGEPCYDPVLRCFDIFTVLDMDQLSNKF